MEEEKQTTKHAYNTEMADLNLSMLKAALNDSVKILHRTGEVAY